MNAPAPGASNRRTNFVVFVLALIVGATYYATFHGLAAVSTKRNPVAFADSDHYVELLSGRHYLACARQEPTHQVEHRRKTVHHIGYLLLADGVVQVARVFAPWSSDLDRIWLVSPLLGALNFVIAFCLFRRKLGDSLALPGALTYALVPANWIYASVPETWMLVATAVLVVLHLRERRIPAWASGLIIAAFALANFLVLLLVLLLDDKQRSLRQRLTNVATAGAFAMAIWLGMLFVLGMTMTPDFLPHRFFELTLRFKERMGENLPIYQPARWAYTLINGWLLPFVLNQRDLNFGRYAIVDSARTFPLGTSSVAIMGLLLISTLRHQMARVRAAGRTVRSRLSHVSGQFMYLVAAFVATGLAMYYEAFLYAPLVIPILLMLALEGLSESPRKTVQAWAITAVWALNAVQQIASFRGALGG